MNYIKSIHRQRVKRPRVKRQRVKRHRVKRPRVKRQGVKNATKGQTTQGQTTKSQKMRQKGKFFFNFDGQYFLLLFKVRLGTFWAERCAQNRLGSRALRPRVRLVKTLSGPSAAARTGQGAERCSQDRLGARGPRLYMVLLTFIIK